MKQGSVVVDLAAEAGGNCEATVPGKLVVKDGVTIIGKVASYDINLAGSMTRATGYTDLPSRLPTQSSSLYSNNITKFLLSIGEDNKYGVNLEDEVVRGSIVVQNGSILPPIPRSLPPPVTPPPTTEVVEPVKAITPFRKASTEVATVTAGMGGMVALGKATGTAFMDNFFTFGLAGLVGYRVVWNVAPALHSPLMSVTNAISGMVGIGGLFGALQYMTCVSIFIHPCLSHGRRIYSRNGPTTAGIPFSSACKCQCCWWICDHETYARHVQTYVMFPSKL